MDEENIIESLQRKEDIIVQNSEIFRNLCTNPSLTMKVCILSSNVVNSPDANSESKLSIFYLYYHILENVQDESREIWRKCVIKGFLSKIKHGFQAFNDKVKPRVLKVLGTWIATGLISYDIGIQIHQLWCEGLTDPPQIVYPPNYTPPSLQSSELPLSTARLTISCVSVPSTPIMTAPTTSMADSAASFPSAPVHKQVISPPNPQTATSPITKPVTSNALPSSKPSQPPNNAVMTKNILDEVYKSKKTVFKFGNMTIVRGQPRKWESKTRLTYHTTTTMPAIVNASANSQAAGGVSQGQQQQAQVHLSGGHFFHKKWQPKSVVSEDMLFVQRMGFIAACVESNVSASAANTANKSGSRSKVAANANQAGVVPRRSTRQRVIREDLLDALRGEAGDETDSDEDSYIAQPAKRSRGGGSSIVGSRI